MRMELIGYDDYVKDFEEQAKDGVVPLSEDEVKEMIEEGITTYHAMGVTSVIEEEQAKDGARHLFGFDAYNEDGETKNYAEEGPVYVRYVGKEAAVQSFT